MSAELKLLIAVSRCLPTLRGAGRIAEWIRRWYARKPRPVEIFQVNGMRMELDPCQCMDGALLFYPHLYDRMEIGFLRQTLAGGGVFVDAGANIGYYTLVASHLSDRVYAICIEADPSTFVRLERNIALNGLTNVVAVHAGISNKRERLTLWRNEGGNLSGNSFDPSYESGNGVAVECDTLHQLLVAHGVDRIDVIKLDIEGFERRVLKKFFAESAIRPEYVIIEENPAYDEDGACGRLLREHRYRVLCSAGVNRIYKLLH